MKNKDLKDWLRLKENEMLVETVKLNGIVIDDHNFVRAPKSSILDGFICKSCRLGIGYEMCKGEDDGAPCVVYPF